MRLAELSERSGVPTATIKYYLREGLLPPGERVTATRSEYGPDHLRRLGLVRALIQVGRVPVAQARQVLDAVDREQDHYHRLGAAVLALPHGPEPDDADPATGLARAEADRLLGEMGWECERGSPPYRMLVASLASLVRLGYEEQARVLADYARAAQDLAAAEMALLGEDFAPGTAQLEAAVTLTVLGEPVLLSLRRLAQADEARRHFGGEAVPGEAVPGEGGDTGERRSG